MMKTMIFSNQLKHVDDLFAFLSLKWARGKLDSIQLIHIPYVYLYVWVWEY